MIHGNGEESKHVDLGTVWLFSKEAASGKEYKLQRCSKGKHLLT